MEYVEFVTEEKHLLQEEENDYFRYEKSIKYNDGMYFEVYIDDYGMSYILSWKNAYGEIEQWSCGMCNSYIFELEDIHNYLLEKGETVVYEQ